LGSSFSTLCNIHDEREKRKIPKRNGAVRAKDPEKEFNWRGSTVHAHSYFLELQMVNIDIDDLPESSGVQWVATNSNQR
jgi:hypothetical protein